MYIGVLVGLDGDIDASIRRVKDFGLSSCQICNWDQSLYTHERADRTAEALAKYGVRVSSFWAGYSGPAIWDHFRCQRNTPAHMRGQLPDQRQAQAGAAVFPRQKTFKLLEFFENLFTAIVRNAGTGIADGKDDFPPSRSDGKCDRSDSHAAGHGDRNLDGCASQLHTAAARDHADVPAADVLRVVGALPPVGRTGRQPRRWFDFGTRHCPGLAEVRGHAAPLVAVLRLDHDGHANI